MTDKKSPQHFQKDFEDQLEILGKHVQGSVEGREALRALADLSLEMTKQLTDEITTKDRVFRRVLDANKPYRDLAEKFHHLNAEFVALNNQVIE